MKKTHRCDERRPLPSWVTGKLGDYEAQNLIESWRPVEGRGLVVVAYGSGEFEIRTEHDARLAFGFADSVVTAVKAGTARIEGREAAP